MRLLPAFAVFLGICAQSSGALAVFELRAYRDSRGHDAKRLVVVFGDFTGPDNIQLLMGGYEAPASAVVEAMLVKSIDLKTVPGDFIFSYEDPRPEASSPGESYIRIAANADAASALKGWLGRTETSKTTMLQQFPLHPETLSNVLVINRFDSLVRSTLEDFISQWRLQHPHFAGFAHSLPIHETFEAPLTADSIERLKAAAKIGSAEDLVKLTSQIVLLKDVSGLADVIDLLVERGGPSIQDRLASDVFKKPSTVKMDSVAARLMRVGSAQARRQLISEALMQPHGQAMRQARLMLAATAEESEFTLLFSLLERPFSIGDFELLQTMLENPRYEGLSMIDSILRAWNVLKMEEGSALFWAAFNTDPDQRKIDVERAIANLRLKMAPELCRAGYEDPKD